MTVHPTVIPHSVVRPRHAPRKRRYFAGSARAGPRLAHSGRVPNVALRREETPTVPMGAPPRRKKRRVRLRRTESVLAEVAEERERAEQQRTFAGNFRMVPLRLRKAVIVSTYLLAAVLALSSHLMYGARAQKRSVYVAADGRGERGQVHLLSAPPSSSPVVP